MIIKLVPMVVIEPIMINTDTQPWQLYVYVHSLVPPCKYNHMSMCDNWFYSPQLGL